MRLAPKTSNGLDGNRDSKTSLTKEQKWRRELLFSIEKYERISDSNITLVNVGHCLFGN